MSKYSCSEPEVKARLIPVISDLNKLKLWEPLLFQPNFTVVRLIVHVQRKIVLYNPWIYLLYVLVLVLFPKNTFLYIFLKIEIC